MVLGMTEGAWTAPYSAMDLHEPPPRGGDPSAGAGRHGPSHACT